MLAISFGVSIAAYGEAKYDSWGVLLQLGAVVFEATRLVLIQILLTSKGISLNPITSLYYVAPSCLAFLLVPWLLVEYPVLKQHFSGFHFDFLIFGTNSLCAFALNLAVFLLSVIKDTVTPLNLFGYGLAFLGVGYYNHSKLQDLKANEAQKKTQMAEEEKRKRLGEGNRDGNEKKGESQDGFLGFVGTRAVTLSLSPCRCLCYPPRCHINLTTCHVSVIWPECDFETQLQKL
ncbi:nucleotide-sugar transporter family protein [Striga asiatica]|uniref:Nucleotide-sugar transporter family protein n=1 Tax=Striga asiatica TaxID=4170 RepID=A0A5A7R7F7_STRAF|nr:nucleotide-sugar transporter family protein [Striga asiatica]